MTCPQCHKIITNIGFLLTNNDDFKHFAVKMLAKNESRTYLNKVYMHLLWMQPGNTIDIATTVKAENLENFVKTVCLFMYERPDYNVQFSNDYQQVIRKQGMPVKKEKETTEKTEKP